MMLFQVKLLAALICLSNVLAAGPLPRAGKNNVDRDADVDYQGYIFAYFTGNAIEGEKIYLAASNGNDALDWQDLNNGQPVLASTQGTKGLRDPFIMRSEDGGTFYLLATDLSIGSGTSWDSSQRNGSRYLEIWESKDLVNWSEQRHVLVSPPTAGMTLAPEAYWDQDIGAYAVYWASSLYAEDDIDHTGASYSRMLYATTQDFVTFSEPQIWQDDGQFSRIDADVLQVDNVYYRFTKATTAGCADIVQDSSTSLLGPLSDWRVTQSCIGQKAGTGAVEGPTAFRSNPGDVHGQKYYLFVDEYGGRGYIPLETADIASPNWKVSANYHLPASPRHGTVLPITDQELERLTASQLSKREDALIPGYYADPNIAVLDRTYFIYPTTDGYPGSGGNQFYVWKSTDLVDWTRSASPILTLNGTSGDVPWATGNAWAPTIVDRDGKYFFYFSGQNPAFDRKTIGVAVSDSPEGPFVAQPEAMILNYEEVTSGQAIDPDVFYDPVSGKYYIYWGNGIPVMAELSDDMLSLKPGTIQAILGLTDFREGSFVVYREPYYHFTYSIDDTGSENYRVGYATSTSPTGPWTYRGVVLQKDSAQGILATGHDSMINVPGTDDWYMAYHRFAIPGGDGTHRETTIDRVTFDAETGLMNTVTPTLDGPRPQTIS